MTTVLVLSFDLDLAVAPTVTLSCRLLRLPLRIIWYLARWTVWYIYKGLLLVKGHVHISMNSFATLILYIMSTPSNIPKLDPIFMLYWSKIQMSCSPRPIFCYTLERGTNMLIVSLNLKLPQISAFYSSFSFKKYLWSYQERHNSFSVNTLFLFFSI
jgi:hypothetical protein